MLFPKLLNCYPVFILTLMNADCLYFEIFPKKLALLILQQTMLVKILAKYWRPLGNCGGKRARASSSCNVAVPIAFASHPVWPGDLQTSTCTCGGASSGGRLRGAAAKEHGSGCWRNSREHCATDNAWS